RSRTLTCSFVRKFGEVHSYKLVGAWVIQQVFNHALLGFKWTQFFQPHRPDGDAYQFLLRQACGSVLPTKEMPSGICQRLQRNESHEFTPSDTYAASLGSFADFFKRDMQWSY